MRLHHIASLLKGFDTALDIGTDHGLVLKYAFDQGFIKKGIAADINEGPLESAKRNLRNYPVKFIKSNGFRQIGDTFEVAVICGMGAYLITDIMIDAPKLESITYILGANDKVHYLRNWLMRNGFKITNETIVHEKFYYQFLVVQRGRMTLTDKEQYLGPILRLKETSRPFYAYQKRYYEDLLHKVPLSQKHEIEKLITWFSWQ